MFALNISFVASILYLNEVTWLKSKHGSRVQFPAAISQLSKTEFQILLRRRMGWRVVSKKPRRFQLWKSAPTKTDWTFKNLRPLWDTSLHTGILHRKLYENSFSPYLLCDNDFFLNQNDSIIINLNLKKI